MIIEKKQFFVVMALIKDREGRLLMQTRMDPEPAWAYGKWEFPGGIIEWGETAEDALQREMQEEIGCRVQINTMIPVIASVVRPDDRGGEYHVLIVGYDCILPEGEIPKPSDAEVGELKWVTPDELSKLNHLPGTKIFLDQLARLA